LIRYLYNMMLFGGMALAGPWLGFRMLRGRYKNITRARLGVGREWLPPVEAKGAIWVHALSVGEVGSALPLLMELAKRHPDRPAAFSVATAQGVMVAQKELGEDSGIHLFIRPMDLPGAVDKLLDRLQPSLFCLVEGDIWPNWQWKLKQRGVPRILVNGRVSPRTFKGYKRLGGLSRELFAGFDRVLVQTPVDHERLLHIGVDPKSLSIGGNLKFDSAPTKLDQAQREALAAELGAYRP
jgi:3-deoxy-D-manno-octulosonic-acid transferase